MKKILIVAEKTNSFYKKYLIQLNSKLIEQKYTTYLLYGESYDFNINTKPLDNKDFKYLSKNLDEHRFIEVFKETIKHNISQVHFCRIIDPQRLYAAINTFDLKKEIRISFSVFGLSEYLRRPIYANYIEKLLALPEINKILMHSIGPNLMFKICKANKYYNSNKVHFIHDPLYENTSEYNLSKAQARSELKLKTQSKIILYFGAYFFSKGPDILLQAALKFKNRDDLDFIFAGNTKSASFEFNKEDYYSPNIHFDDRFISDEIAIKYMIASDLVVLPYRKFYENNTSGVFVQSCLAKTPLLVPDINPFKDVLEAYDLGLTFKCESSDSLKNEISNFFNSTNNINPNFEGFIDNITKWDEIAELIVQADVFNIKT